MSGYDRTTRPGARANETEGGDSPSLRDLALRRRMVQRKVAGGASPLSGPASAVGNAAAGGPAAPEGGVALPGDVRAKMERAFSADFSAVRIHVGPEAAQLGAQAFTRGDAIHFAPGKYDPSSPAGQELLGHELAHVVQQRGGSVPAPQGKEGHGTSVHDDAALESKADEAGARAAHGEPVEAHAQQPQDEAKAPGEGTKAKAAGAPAAAPAHDPDSKGGGEGPVQAKLNFDAARLKEEGGSASFASRITGGSYQKLIDLLVRYEKQYAKDHQDPALKATLSSIQHMCIQWLNAHRDDKPERQKAANALLAETTRELTAEELALKEAAAFFAERGGVEDKADAGPGPSGAGAGGAMVSRPPPLPPRPGMRPVPATPDVKADEAEPEAASVEPAPAPEPVVEAKSEEHKVEGGAGPSGGMPAMGHVEAMKAKLGGGIPMGAPSSGGSRGMVREQVRSGGDAEFKSQAPQSAEAMPRTQGEGIAIQNALHAAGAAVNAGTLEPILGEAGLAAIVELLDQLSDDAAQWSVTPPKASDQIALLNLLAQIQSASAGGIRSAMAGFGIDVDEADKDDDEKEDKGEVKADADAKVDPEVEGDEDEEEDLDPDAKGDREYLAHQQNKLGKLDADRADGIQQKGADKYRKDQGTAATKQKVKAKVKTVAAAAVGSAAGHFVPGVSQAYSLARAMNQVRSTMRHLKNLRRLRKSALTRHDEGSVAIGSIDYAIAQKSKKKTRSAIGGIPLVGTAKTAVLKLRGLYKLAMGKRGNDRRAWADLLIQEANKGDPDLKLVILELVGKDQYNIVLSAPQGIDLLVAKLASG